MARRPSKTDPAVLARLDVGWQLLLQSSRSAPADCGSAPVRRNCFERVDVVDPLFESAEQGAVFVVESVSGCGDNLLTASVTVTHFDAKSGALKAFVRTAIVLQNTATEPDQPKGKADAEYNRPWIEKVIYGILSVWIPRQWYPSSISKLSIQSPGRASRLTSFNVSNLHVIAGQNSFMNLKSTTSLKRGRPSSQNDPTFGTRKHLLTNRSSAVSCHAPDSKQRGISLSKKCCSSAVNVPFNKESPW